ncbi:MAG: hypothetical protein ABEJ77_04240 [Halanaeroarchaeum sp.]
MSAVTTLSSFAGEDESAETAESGSVVVAECVDCDSIHAVAERESAGDTTAATVCPACGSTSYATTVEEVDP